MNFIDHLQACQILVERTRMLTILNMQFHKFFKTKRIFSESSHSQLLTNIIFFALLASLCSKIISKKQKCKKKYFKINTPTQILSQIIFYSSFNFMIMNVDHYYMIIVIIMYRSIVILYSFSQYHKVCFKDASLHLKNLYQIYMITLDICILL